MAAIKPTSLMPATEVFLSLQESNDQRAWQDLGLQCQRLEKYIALGAYVERIDTILTITLTDLLKYSQWLANDKRPGQESCWSKTLLISLNVLRAAFADTWTEMYNALNRGELGPLLEAIEPNFATRRMLSQRLTEVEISQSKMGPSCHLPDIKSEYRRADLAEVKDLLTNYLSFFEWMETDLVPNVNKLLKIWLNQKRDQLITSTTPVNKRLLDPNTLERCDLLLNICNNPDHNCPITGAIMIDPVKAEPCGHYFEKEAILSWRERNATCPLDRVEMTKLVDDPILKQVIDRSFLPLLSLENIHTVNCALELLEEQKRLSQDPRFLARYPQIFEQAATSDASLKDFTVLYPQEKDYQYDRYLPSECRIFVFDELWNKYNLSRGEKFTEGTKEHSIYKVARLELCVECAFIKAIRQAAGYRSLEDAEIVLGAYRTVEGAESMSPETLTKILMRAANATFKHLEKRYKEYIQKQIDLGINPFATAPDFIYDPERPREPDDIFSTFQQGKLPSVRYLHFREYPGLDDFLEESKSRL